MDVAHDIWRMQDADITFTQLPPPQTYFTTYAETASDTMPEKYTATMILLQFACGGEFGVPGAEQKEEKLLEMWRYHNGCSAVRTTGDGCMNARLQSRRRVDCDTSLILREEDRRVS